MHHLRHPLHKLSDILTSPSVSISVRQQMFVSENVDPMTRHRCKAALTLCPALMRRPCAGPMGHAGTVGVLQNLLHHVYV